MTLVNAETGEVVTVDLSEDEARDLTDQIASDLTGVWELIKQAYIGRAWNALYYSSWDEYCREEFGASRLRLPSEERREVVGSLRDAGLSIRAIAAATGTSSGTVHSDLSAGVQNRTPADQKGAPVTGTDGKTYPSKSTTTDRDSRSTTTTTGPVSATAGDDEAGAGRSTAPSEPDDAEVLNDAFDRHADPRLTFRANFSKDLAKAGVLRMVDVDKAIASADPDDLAGFRQSVQSIRDWCDRFLGQSNNAHLRRVK